VSENIAKLLRGYAGHADKSRELTQRAVDSTVRSDSKGNGAIWQSNAALREAAYGEAAQARQTVAAALKLALEGQGAEAALAFAMAGTTQNTLSLTN